jgi:hypothetical protein
MRALIDPHFTATQSLKMLSVMIQDTNDWLKKLPNLPTVKRDEKKNQLVIKCEELVSELPFKMIARVVFGDLITDEVSVSFGI